MRTGGYLDILEVIDVEGGGDGRCIGVGVFNRDSNALREVIVEYTTLVGLCYNFIKALFSIWKVVRGSTSTWSAVVPDVLAHNLFSILSATWSDTHPRITLET
jgi:hypothetical protein